MKKILRLVIFRLHSTNTVDLRAKIDRPASIYVRFHRAFASMTPEEYDLICVTMNHLRENLRYFSSPLRLGLVGISGYAGYIGRWLVSADGLPPSDLSLTSMYVPDPHLHQERISELSKLGVTFHPSYEALLEDNLDFVWLPVPMHLHRVMTEEALARGVSVMCEKPVAATIEDAMAMHEASRRARVPVLIGFQNMFEPATLELKRALLNARDNDPLHAVVTAGWPRGAKYYKRNDWAGRLRKNGDWVLDGPAGNAMAHFINLAAFLLGQNEMESARPVSIEAELYRANAIESYDTFSARVRFADNSTMTALLTHACETDIEPTVSISGPRINACWRDLTDRVDVRRDGLVSMILRAIDPRVAMVQRVVDTVKSRQSQQRTGKSPTIELAANIGNSLAHAMIANGALEASRIHTLPKSAWRRIVVPDQGDFIAINGIEGALSAVANEGKLLNELGLFDWSRTPGHLNLIGYHTFKGPKQYVGQPVDRAKLPLSISHKTTDRRPQSVLAQSLDK